MLNKKHHEEMLFPAIRRKNVHLSQEGSGSKRMVLLSLLKAQLDKKSHELQNKYGCRPNTIFAVEEPEASQHPKNTEMIVDRMQVVADDDRTQAIITTRAPNVAAMLDVECIRFFRYGSRQEPVVLQASGSDDNFLAEVANDLGVYPDLTHQCRLVLFVEGKTDVWFLENISKIYHEIDPVKYPLVSPKNKAIAIVPLGGTGNLRDWTHRDYLKNFHVGKKVYFFDRDDLQRQQERHAYIAAIRQQDDIPIVTKKREIENYIPIDAIKLAVEKIGLKYKGIKISADDNVEKIIYNTYGKSLGKPKEFLCKVVTRYVNYEMLEQAEDAQEIANWLTTINEAIKHNENH